jgi:hypothetical protein
LEASYVRVLVPIAGFLALLLSTTSVAQVKKPPDPKPDIKKLLADADERYRTLYERPREVVEFWAALQFEITVGKFDIAGLHLDLLLKKEPKADVDQKLLDIEEAEGLGSFVKLQEVRKWHEHPDLEKQARDNVRVLIQRVLDALEKRLGDPARLNKFIKNLSAPTREERAFALVQLQRAQERAGPYLVEALRNTTGTPHNLRVQEAILKLDRSAVPSIIEVLKPASDKDAKDTDLRPIVLDLLRRRADDRIAPYLWYLSSSLKVAPSVRAQAKEGLAQLLQVDPELLPPAKVALTRLAEDYYQHRVRFAEPKRVRIWPWDGQKIEPTPVVLNASEAEQYFGNRYAKEALDLDPAYQPAQIIYLSLRLEREYQDNLDQFLLGKSPSATPQLLATLDTELLTAVLERALTERNPAVILPIVQTLGERGEVRAIQSAGSGAQGVLVRSLYYPDRRVQFASVRALLRMPSTASPVATTRVVEVLRRFIAADAVPKALLAFMTEEQKPELRKAITDAGFQPIFTASIKKTMERLRENADIDIILLNPTMADNELPFVISQMRGDSDVGLLPMLLLAAPKRESTLARAAKRYRNITMLPEALVKDPAQLKTQLENAIKFAAVSDLVLRAPEEQRGWLEDDVKKSKGRKLSDAERKQLRREAMDHLWRMARGELPGYEVRIAEAALAHALRTEELAVPALEVMSRIPGPDAQQRLAAFVLDPARGKLRVTATIELNRHLQKHGLGLNNDQIGRLQSLHNNPAEDANVRAQLALFVGSLRSTPQQTGQRLLNPPKMPPAKQ